MVSGELLKFVEEEEYVSKIKILKSCAFWLRKYYHILNHFNNSRYSGNA